MAASIKDSADGRHHPPELGSGYGTKLDSREDKESSSLQNNPLLRLNRYIASSGICSRRKAEDLIRSGKVSINGKVITDLSMRVFPGELVEVDGMILQDTSPLTYVLLYKPVEVVSTVHDPQGRRTVVDILPRELNGLRLFPVGRLDYFSEGLLLMTNDGAVANELMHPRYHLPKTYEVLIRGEVPQEALADMRKGMAINIDGHQVSLLPVPLEYKRDKNGNTLLTMILRQGINRQIRRMAQKWNLTILRLKRTKLGELSLGDLKPGQTRILTSEALKLLRNKF